MHGQVKLFLLYERVSPFSKVGRHHSHMQTPGLLVSWMLDKDYTNCKLKFHSRTPPLFINSIFSLSPQRLADRHAALIGLLEHGVIILLPVAGCTQGFYSDLFTYPKHKGGIHPSLDLKALNALISAQKCDMEFIRSIIASLHQRHSGLCGHQGICTCMPPFLQCINDFFAADISGL